MSVSASILARRQADGFGFLLTTTELKQVGEYVAELEQALTEASKALEDANASLQVSALTVRPLTQRIPQQRDLDAELHRLRQRLAGWHFGQESLTPTEREILHVAEAVLRVLDVLTGEAQA